MAPESMSAKETSASLGCCVDTVYEMVEDGRLKGFCFSGKPFVRKGTRGRKGLRILATSVDDFVAAAIRVTAVTTAEQEVSVPPPAAIPSLQSSVKKPLATAKSKTKVVLPYPGQKRSTIP
jgi:hypothetical protein